MCQIKDKRDYAIKLTHGDLNSFNIIINNDKIAGIIDWEMAGWYPDYWEFTSAWHANVYDEFWRPEVEKILEAVSRTQDMQDRKFNDIQVIRFSDVKDVSNFLLSV